ncbi:putative mitochondrial import receptor subunit [Pseudovirgaria hyperparasitica]|uniref:Translocase of outer membrane 40 kDa subunit n=1 Tax=Pseudovirgaria hyperparasitica TaxID=470096 RepID=A0A6A6W8G9_9PEZI|nr:putative mitochondrial import receptor subunit [Pseudovirgaria hyperparasitica]KAF2759178.1 putative mitochondrial import receptor subunit [Pseudovirgaria hyperparasitica]
MALDTKDVPLVIPQPSTTGGIFGRVQDVYTAYSERRAALGLSNPGTVDNISREVTSGVFLNNQSFSGLRADITKAFSVSPLFQISHALSMGSQGLPPYGFTALFGNNRVFCQANIDNDFALQARFNYRWTPSQVTKTNVQLAPQAGGSMISLEHDFTGDDFTASIKSMNPSILDGGLTGIFVGSYLQSITPALSLGLEGVWQRAATTHGPEVALSYSGKYKGEDWQISAQVLGQGAIEAAYWKKLTDKLETGVSTSLQFAGLSGASMMGGPSKEGTTTIGAKYDFRQSQFRAQIDSNGKVSALLEKRVAQSVQVTFFGEIDHYKPAPKLGLAVSIEAAGEEVLEQQEKLGEAPAIPF